MLFGITHRKHFAYRDLQEKGMHSKYADWFRQIDWNKPNKCGDSFTVEGWNGFQELLNWLNSSSVQQKSWMWLLFGLKA